jgi:hypothetical protein
VGERALFILDSQLRLMGNDHSTVPSQVFDRLARFPPVGLPASSTPVQMSTSCTSAGGGIYRPRSGLHQNRSGHEPSSPRRRRERGHHQPAGASRYWPGCSLPGCGLYFAGALRPQPREPRLPALSQPQQRKPRPPNSIRSPFPASSRPLSHDLILPGPDRHTMESISGRTRH